MTENKVIIITGGAKGIGKAMVERLARENYHIVLNYHTSEKEAKQIQKNLKKENIYIEIFQADVSKREKVKQLISFTLQKYHHIDVIINNAGIALSKVFTDITEEEWNQLIQTNLTSIFYMIQEALPSLLQNQKGCIINISSIWGMVGSSCEVAYSATKAGVDGLTKALAKELGPSHIRVNSIAPGIIDTEMNQHITQMEKEEIQSEIPLGSIGKAEDIANCAKWLIEDQYTTGQIISINGGWVIT